MTQVRYRIMVDRIGVRRVTGLGVDKAELAFVLAGAITLIGALSTLILVRDKAVVLKGAMT